MFFIYKTNYCPWEFLLKKDGGREVKSTSFILNTFFFFFFFPPSFILKNNFVPKLLTANFPVVDYELIGKLTSLEQLFHSPGGSIWTLGFVIPQTVLLMFLKWNSQIFFCLFGLKLSIFVDFENKIFPGTCRLTFFSNTFCIVIVQHRDSSF